jgi:chromosomal replication initiator protein
MQRAALTFARFVAMPENQRALLAVRHVAERLVSKLTQTEAASLLLHGPSGTGKTHLVQALVAEVTRRCRDLVVCLLPAADWFQPGQPGWFAEAEQPEPVEQAKGCDLLVVENLQHLHPLAVEPLVQVFDYLHARNKPMVFTANAAPQRLARRGERLASRLTNRLAGGLVVPTAPLGASGRFTLLQTLAQRRQLAVPTAVLRWLADHLGGGARQLEGAVARLETLARADRQPLDLAAAQSHFQEDIALSQPTIDRIAVRVGGYFDVELRQLLSARRHREVVVPRQIGMYLARQLTRLSLEQIGAYFGGRDHTTVLHACRKVEVVIEQDAVLSGAVHEIGAEFA